LETLNLNGPKTCVIGDLIASMIGALIGGALFEKTGTFAANGLIGNLIVATMTDKRMDQISVFINILKGRFRFHPLNLMNGYIFDKPFF
jgi:hypothetical protein